MNIILAGLPACGKTTIGRQAAQQWNWNFIDNDKLIEQAYEQQTGKKKSCREIFQEKGEPFFRYLESKQLQQLDPLNFSLNSIIALGGGALHSLDNRKKISSFGHLIYLQCDLFLLWKRIESRGLSAYLKDRKDFYLLAEERVPLFQEMADSILDVTHLSPQEAAEKLWQVIHSEPFSKFSRGVNRTEKQLE